MQYTCHAVSAGEARKWLYSNSTLRLAHSNVSANRAQNTSDGQGGGLCATNVHVFVDSCILEANVAGASGGGIHLEAGSAALSLQGNTTVRKNTAGESGTAIFSSSGGSIHIEDSVTIDIAPRSMTGSAAPGITLLSAGAVEYDAHTQLQCSKGEQLWVNMSTVQTTFNEWLVDCNELRVADNGSSFEYVQPTCKQLQEGNSPRHTYTANCLPMQPDMLMTTGTISCVPCTHGLYVSGFARHRLGPFF